MSEVSKHTPGPWYLEETDTALWIGVEKAAGGKVGDIITSMDVGEDYNPWHNELALANARLIVAAPTLKAALAAMLDCWGGYECPEVDAAIAVMQDIGEDRWSMQAQMDAAKAEADAAKPEART